MKAVIEKLPQSRSYLIVTPEKVEVDRARRRQPGERADHLVCLFERSRRPEVRAPGGYARKPLRSIEGLLGVAGRQARAERVEAGAASRPRCQGRSGKGGLRWLSCDIEDVIERPLITEKNTMLMETGSTPSRWRPRRTRSRSRRRSRQTFNVRVKAVNTLNVKPKAEIARRPADGVGASSGTSRPGRKRS